MSQSLFFVTDPHPAIGTCFHIRPYDENLWNDYYLLRKKIRLKEDLRWDENKDFQQILRRADIWPGFPAVGLTLVDAEFRPGDENQRVDLLYMRDDGGLLPCELKLGGMARDTPGQLVRYMSDLAFQKVDRAFIAKRRKHFLATHFDNDIILDGHKRKMAKFMREHNITNKFIRLLPQSGILIDEGFPPQLLKAVRFLNASCGFSIRLLRVEAYVAESWKTDAEEYLMRLDFVDIQ